MQTFESRSAFFLSFFERDFLKMKEEILLYAHEDDLWLKQPNISNSAGNLFLHIMGNLRHFIGATLGKTGYVRNRDYEFSASGVSISEMMEEWDQTAKDVQLGLSKVGDEQMKEAFPLEKHGEIVSNEFMLMHLYSHLNYHLGQINYHRRLLAI
jgi:uncharacterized damage-inducible protein DinB